MQDLLNGAELSRRLSDFSNLRVVYSDVCDSTNNEAKRMVANGFSGNALLVAAEQTAGRGRRGRSFYSPPGSGVYFSVLYTTPEPLGNAVSVTCAASVAVMRAIRACCGLQTEIKWVNDIRYRDRKVCGILTEAIRAEAQTHIIVGIGVNLRRAEFPPELAGIAGSLDDGSTPRAALIAECVRELIPFLRNLSSREWLDDYRAVSSVIGKEITFTRGDAVIPALAVGIDRDGGLTVRTEVGEETLRTGEITVRLAEK